MKKISKILLYISSGTLLVGGITTGIVMTIVNRNIDEEKIKSAWNKFIAENNLQNINVSKELNKKISIDEIKKSENISNQFINPITNKKYWLLKTQGTIYLYDYDIYKQSE